MLTTSSAPSVWRVGGRAAGLAAAANVAIFGAGRALGVDFVVDAGGNRTTVTAVQVGVGSLVAVVVGTVAARAAWPWRRGTRLVQAVATVVTVASLGGPLSMGTAPSTRLLLSSMHVVAGWVFVAAMQRVGGPSAHDSPEPSSGPVVSQVRQA